MQVGDRVKLTHSLMYRHYIGRIFTIQTLEVTGMAANIKLLFTTEDIRFTTYLHNLEVVHD